MTAAHCLDRDIDSFKIVFGTSDLGNFGAGQVYYPKSILIHPNYAGIYDFQDDVALIQLSEPLPASIPPVTLISDNQLQEPGREARAVGWGLVNSDFRNPESTNLLQQTDLPIVTHEFANLDDYYHGQVKESMLPAGIETPYKSVHSGDSGGPLLMLNQEAGLWEQIGISSYGAGCNKPNNPISVFTRVSEIKDWLDLAMEHDFFTWANDHELTQLNQEDGDDHSPLVEWIFGLDPREPDTLDWTTGLITEQREGQSTLFLPLLLENPSPIFSIQSYFSEDLENWEMREPDWQGMRNPDYTGLYPKEFYLPISFYGHNGFQRLELEDYSGIIHGPTPLRVGSRTRGYFGRGYGGNGLYPWGLSRFHYILNIPDYRHPLKLGTDSDDPIDINLRLYELNRGEKLVDSRLMGRAINQSISVEEGNTYLLEIEGSEIDYDLWFDLILDQEHPKDFQSLDVAVTGSLSEEDSFYIREGYYADRHHFFINSFPLYKVELSSETLDPIIIVNNADESDLLHEIDEEPPRVAEQFILSTSQINRVEVIAGSWRFGETGDYQLELQPYEEPESARPSDTFLGIFHPQDNTDNQNDTTWVLDPIRLESVSPSTGVTIKVYGVEDFTPYFAIFNTIDQETVHNVYTRCSNSSFFFNPEQGKAYELLVYTTDRDMYQNYQVKIEAGNTLPEEDPSLETPDKKQYTQLLEAEAAQLPNIRDFYD